MLIRIQDCSNRLCLSSLCHKRVMIKPNTLNITLNRLLRCQNRQLVGLRLDQLDLAISHNATTQTLNYKQSWSSSMIGKCIIEVTEVAGIQVQATVWTKIHSGWCPKGHTWKNSNKNWLSNMRKYRKSQLEDIFLTPNNQNLMILSQVKWRRNPKANHHRVVVVVLQTQKYYFRKS